MATFKCKMCGGNVKFNPGDSVGVCDSCGTRQPLPRLNGYQEPSFEEEDRPECEPQAEQRGISAEKPAKKQKLVIAIAAPIAIVGIAFLIVLMTVLIPRQKLNKVMSLLESGNYNAASVLLEEISGKKVIASSRYDRAAAFISSGNYEAAYILLDGLDYKDSASMRKTIEDSDAWLRICPVGGTVFFGTYEQDNTTDGKEDIEWIVLEREGDRILVISRYALDCQPYNTSYTSVTWETCSLRKWLNGSFLNEALSESEKAMIPSVTVSADGNPNYSTSPGNSTTDQVFMLSIREANKYFGSDSARQCQGTVYCNAQGINLGSNGNCWWWLRSPGYDSNYVAGVNFTGSVHYGGGDVDHEGVGIRPAMWIDLKP